MFLPHGVAIMRQVVEASNESILAKGFKSSGKKWITEDGQAKMTFRALTPSGRFGRAKDVLPGDAEPARQILAA